MSWSGVPMVTLSGLTTQVFILALSLLSACAANQETRLESDGPIYDADRSLVRPSDYREWPFLGAGVGMTYEEDIPDGDSPTFTNVFVNPSAYRRFMDSGVWPDRSVFVLEFRHSETDVAPNRGGRFQGELLGLEAEVKDARFDDGWAFFNFRRGPTIVDVTEPLSGEAAQPCVECHTNETAVERTFVQFYPTLLEVARGRRTLKPGF